MRIYIAGPMTGINEFNHPAFTEAAAVIRAQGHHAVNPAEFNPVLLDYATCMRRCITALLESDAIALLPGWSDSPGATLELQIADILGMAVYFLVEGDLERRDDGEEAAPA